MALQRKVTGDTLCLMNGGEQVLSMREVQKDRCFEIILEGSLKSDVVFDLQDELTSLMIAGFDLRLDLEKVTYLSPACANAFLDIQMEMDRKGKGSLTLCSVSGAVMQQLESTGMSELLMIE